MSCLLFPYFVMLISLMKWQMNYLQLLNLCHCRYSHLFLFSFHWKTNMYAVWVCITVACHDNLKLKTIHILVGYMRDLLFSVDIFNHTLKNKIKHPWNVFSEISVIFSFINYAFCFLYFFHCICKIWYSPGLSWKTMRRCCQKEIDSFRAGLYRLFFFASWIHFFRWSNIFSGLCSFFFFCFFYLFFYYILFFQKSSVTLCQFLLFHNQLCLVCFHFHFGFQNLWRFQFFLVLLQNRIVAVVVVFVVFVSVG